ncbi:MAG: DUF1116 domain-containing protein [Chloroflexi bacterium]|nr:DUF1116 domain-containing protein [Chloroflexota bacterium]
MEWRPPADGDPELDRVLRTIESAPAHGAYRSVGEANRAVARELIDAEPWLVDVVPAARAMPVFAEHPKLLLHAGPPMVWEEMTGPMRGAVAGAALYEGWVNEAPEAERQAAAGEIAFRPCHDAGAVGPMGGITSPSMPVLVVENRTRGNRGYCILNEGIGRVLRFGANGPDVVERLVWMRDVLGPALGAAARAAGGIDLRGITARAITMGDEFHQRNIAASALFLRAIAPWLEEVDVSASRRSEVLRFLGATEQFFLNVAMAYGKVSVDAARTIRAGTVVTTMTRNGVRFGVRLSGTGDRWFTAPVNTPRGIYFASFDEADGNPDIGDSAVTETIGWGGCAMAAAPGVIRFLGAGGFADAVDITRSMADVCVASNPHFLLPTLDFEALPVGLDAMRVVELGVEPIINTGIAHRQAGIGQVGAGTVRAPLACFRAALRGYAETLEAHQ